MVSGETLDRPAGCPEPVYQLMLGCWRRQPHERLAVKDILQCLELMDQAPSLPPVHREAVDKQSVVIGNATQQQQQSTTTTDTATPSVPYLELISTSVTA